jgi:hypothetical protein
MDPPSEVLSTFCASYNLSSFEHSRPPEAGTDAADPRWRRRGRLIRHCSDLRVHASAGVGLSCTVSVALEGEAAKLD